MSWPACPYRTVHCSVLAGLSLPQCVQQCPGRLVRTDLCTAQCPGRLVPTALCTAKCPGFVSTAQYPGFVSTEQCPGLSLQHSVLAALSAWGEILYVLSFPRPAAAGCLCTPRYPSAPPVSSHLPHFCTSRLQPSIPFPHIISYIYNFPRCVQYVSGCSLYIGQLN